MSSSNIFRYFFLDTDDLFFKDTLLKIDFKNFFYMFLRQEQYHNIWFLEYSESENKIEMISMEEDSRKLLSERIKYIRKPKFTERKGRFFIKKDPEDIRRLLVRMFEEKDRKYAFILTAPDYEKLYGTVQTIENKEEYQSHFILTCSLQEFEKNRKMYPKAFRKCDETAESEALVKSRSIHKEQIKYLVQRFCLSQLNDPQNAPDPVILKNLLLEKEFKNAEKTLSLEGFVESLLEDRERNDILSFRTRSELKEQFMNGYFWKFWNVYERA